MPSAAATRVRFGGDLTGAPGFPLRNRAARHADRGGQLILRPALILARGADAGANVLRSRSLRQLTSVLLTSPDGIADR